MEAAMLRLKPQDLTALKKNTDLVAVAQARGVALTKQGNDYVGLCPFHEETTPSFHVTPVKNLYHCFGCDAAGSVIDFVMRKDGLDFRRAVDVLLTESGVAKRGAGAGARPPGEQTNGGRLSTGRGQPYLEVSEERVQVLLERVISIYQKNWSELPQGRAYLAQRGLNDLGLLTQHQAGYSDGRLRERLPNEGRTWEELNSLGILYRDGRERFAGCVVFPVRDAQQRIITLYGRRAVPDLHAANGAKEGHHYFLPGRPTGLWNAAACKSHAQIILVESILDALSVQMTGAFNVAAIQGTQGLSEADAGLLAESGVQRVLLLLDGDEAGQTAAQKITQRLAGFHCENRVLPDGHDPNSYLVAHGVKGLAEIISAPPASVTTPGGHMVRNDQVQRLPDGLAINLSARRYELHGVERGPRKLRATVRVEEGGKLHVDTLDFYSARARRQLAEDLSRVFEQGAEAMELEVLKLVAFAETEPEKAPAAVGMLPQAHREAEAFGQSPDLIERILADFERCGLVGEKANKLLCYLASVSRKMDKPLSLLILSSSGAGKTTLQDTALRFCPPEDLIKLTSLSGKALFYKEQSSLQHKVLALEEGDGMQEATYAIRNLVSAGELVIEATIKDPATGKLVTMTNRVQGPTAVFITTTDPETDPETKSRFFITSVDESREQTQAILTFQRRRQTLAGLVDGAELEPVLQRHHNFQRLLQPVAVVNPYAEQLSYGDDRLQSRRDQPKYLNLIQAVAFLRQMQKPRRHWAGNGQSREYIEVDRADIRLANELATEILGHSLEELSRPGYELLMLLEKMVLADGHQQLKEKDDDAPLRIGRCISRRDIREFAGWSHARVHRYLHELIELEYVLVESGRNGVLQRYRLAYDGQGKDGRKFVLGLKPVDDLQAPAAA
jgi:DNA primase catalytic core